jgi:hypothetical protein
MLTDQQELSSSAWQRLVAELSAPAPDDRAFLDRLLRVLGQVSAARQAVVFVPMNGERGELIVRPIALWPSPTPAAGGSPAGASSPPPLLAGDDVMRAAYAAIESGVSRVFALSGDGAGFDPSGASERGHVIALALPSEPGTQSAGDAGAATTDGAQPTPGQTSAPASKSAGPAGVPGSASCPGAITLMIEARSRGAIQSTMAMSEVVLGYIHLHSVRGALRRSAASFSATDGAAKLLAAINGASTFKSACITVVNTLARQHGADRAAMAWVRRDACTLVAISDTEHFDRRTAILRKLEEAMDECLDQDQPVLFPAPALDEDAVLGQAIVHCHRELAAGDARLRVCSMPLRAGDEVVGVLTLESRGGSGSPAIDPSVVDRIQATLDLVAPTLATRRRDDQALPIKALESLKTTSAMLVGPRHTLWKLGAILVLVVVVFCTLYTTDHRVGATAELRPLEQRIIASPIDGVILSLREDAEAGRLVKAGQPLIDLDTSELKLQAQEARARVVQAEKAMAQAMKESKPADAARAQAQADAARAQESLFLSRVERSTISAPIDGTLVSGNLRDKVGASVKLGEELFRIAPLGRMSAVVKLDETDLLLGDDGQPLIRPGTRGEIATRSNPGAGFALTVQRVVPLAQAEDGKNQFEVWTTVDEPASWMRPGMEGVVRLDSGRRSLMWIGTRRVTDALRVWFWW